MVDDHVLDLIPGYALGVLDEVDLLQVARHLPHCAACRSALSQHLETVDLIALSGPLHSPPPGLRAEVIRHVERRAVQVSAPVHTAPARSARQPGFWQRLHNLFAAPGALLAGAALLLVIILGVTNLVLWQQVGDLRARLPEGNMRLVALQGTESAPDAVGYLMVFHDDNYGALAVENAPLLEPGYQYQIWLILDGKRTSGGVFSVNETGYGTLQVSADRPLDTFQSFGITVEPAGGSPQPTGKKVLGGDL